jgi:hypothetical protein
VALLSVCATKERDIWPTQALVCLAAKELMVLIE